MLQYPGASDGAVKVVREGGGGVAYSWSAAEGKWEKIGQVVDEPGTMTGGGNMYQVRGAPPLSSKNSSKNSKTAIFTLIRDRCELMVRETICGSLVS